MPANHDGSVWPCGLMIGRSLTMPYYSRAMPRRVGAAVNSQSGCNAIDLGKLGYQLDIAKIAKQGFAGASGIETRLQRKETAADIVVIAGHFHPPVETLPG